MLDYGTEYADPFDPDELDDRVRYDDLYLTRSALADLPRGEPLITDVLDRHTVFVVAGRDQTFKSFVVLDWLLCLATGTPWFGRPVERTRVLLVVGEGAWGLGDRVTAWEVDRGVDVDDEWFHVRRAPVNLFKQAGAFADLLDRVRDQGYGVVVFDTLQRMSAGADQNSARDAGVIIEALDKVRHATADGSVGVVALTDKGDNDTRGSSAFEDDADIVWRTKRDDEEQTITVTLAKRKDGPDGLSLELRADAVKGTGSLVLKRATSLLPVQRRPPARTLDALRLLAGSAVGPDGLSASAVADGIGVSGNGSVIRVLNYLLDEGFATKTPDGRVVRYRITDDGRTRLNRVESDLGEVASGGVTSPHLTQNGDTPSDQQELPTSPTSPRPHPDVTPIPARPLGGAGEVGGLGGAEGEEVYQ